MDRPAAIRCALRDIVAEVGFHGASMSAVANQAGVATGTTYVHYHSKDELVFATYVELKTQLAAAAMAGYREDVAPYARWRRIVTGMYRFLADDPSVARFLTQLEESPYHEEAHARYVASGDPFSKVAQAPDIRPLLIDLPETVIYSLSLGVPVRLIAAGERLTSVQLDRLIDATWRAITVPQASDG